VQLWSYGETIRMVFEATRKANEVFQYKVRYKLADKTGSENPSE
jgi:hypothetical protein